MYLVCTKAQGAKAVEGIKIQGKGCPHSLGRKFYILNLSSHIFRPLFNSFVVIKTIQSSE